MAKTDGQETFGFANKSYVIGHLEDLKPDLPYIDILEMAFSPAFVWPLAGRLVGWREPGKPVVLTTVLP